MGDEFYELDDLVEIARKTIGREKEEGKLSPKYYTYPKMIRLMIAEVDNNSIRWDREGYRRWTIEVDYRGITFITTVGSQEEVTEEGD